MKPFASNPFLFAAIAALLPISYAHAADGTWNGITGNWTDTTNPGGVWVGGAIADLADSTAFFTGVDIATDQTITLNGNRTIGNITFTDATTSSNNLTITGNTLTFDRTSGVPSIDVTQAARQLSISSIIAGNDGLQKNGAGTLRLTAANTFTNGLTINAGTVFVNPLSGINPLGNNKVTIGDVGNTGAAAELLYIGDGANHSFSNLIDVRGNGTATIRALGYNPTFSGAINLGNNLNVISNNNFGSNIGISGGVTGTGNLVIQSNAANGTTDSFITFSGATVNMTGTITNSGTTTSATDSHTTISAVIGTNVTGITQNSTNSQLFLTANNTFIGNITVTAGTLNASLGQGGNNPTSGALGNPSTAGRQVTIASGASLNFNNGDVLGQGGTGNTLLTLIANGGTIRNNGNILNTLGPVQLNGGTLTSTATGNGFKLTGTVTVGGSAVSTISASGAVGSSGVITYDVADAVVGSGSDLNVTAVVADIFGAGGIIKTGAGTMTLSNVNTFTGLTRVDNGTLTLNHATNTLPNAGAINVNGGTLALGTNTDTVGAVTLTSGSITGSGTGTLTGSSYGVQSGSVSAKLAGASVVLTKSTAGTVTLSGINTYTGATNVDGGTLAVSGAGTINSTSAINVAAGAKFVYNSSVALTVAPTLNGSGSNKATFSGTGTINAAMTLNSVDDVISPGNSPGVQAYGANQTWSAFSYDWELNDWDNTIAGTDIDQIQITGTLDLSAVTANQYLLNILSLNNANASGLVGAGGANTFTEANRSWNILTTTTGITGFNASEWQIVPGGFQDVETGTWSINQSGNNLVLNYTVIPEPNVAALLGGLGVLALLRRRRA